MSKKSAAQKVVPIKGPSLMEPGKGSERVSTRFVILYGGPKCEKTTAASYLDGAKWLVSDPNCLGVETKFITTQGVKSFKDFINGDHVVVLTHTGQWKAATVRCYGDQQLVELTFGRGRNTQTVRATLNHQWLLASGLTVKTTDLRNGDKLLKPPHIIRDWSFEEAPEMEQRAWILGFIWGDGASYVSHGKELGARVQLCGEKAKFRERFERFNFTPTYPDSAEGEPHFHLPGWMKHLPVLDVGIEYLTAFVRGLLDADGTKNARRNDAEVNPFQGIQVTGDETIEFVRRAFPAVGAYIVKETDVTEQVTNYGERSDTTVYFSLVLGFTSSAVAPYIVRNIGERQPHELVWCLEVQDDQSFVLPSGIVTRNCIPTLDAWDRLPPEEDVYEVTSVPAAREVLGKMIGVCKEHGAKGLGCTAVVVDSLTQFQDWHEQDVAQATNQRFMGDNKKEGGWQQFNAEFSAFIDDLGVLSRYITVVAIAHAKEKIDGSKGDWAGLNLRPQMALKAGRTANWVLYQSKRTIAVESSFKGDEFTRVAKDKDGKNIGTEVIIYTQPVGFWMAAVNAKNLRPEEPANLAELLRKEGLFK